MASTIPEGEKRQRLRELVSKFETAMLVTRTESGGMRARPLSIADDGDAGALYFSTAIHVEPIEAAYWDLSGGQG